MSQSHSDTTCSLQRTDVIEVRSLPNATQHRSMRPENSPPGQPRHRLYLHMQSSTSTTDIPHRRHVLPKPLLMPSSPSALHSAKTRTLPHSACCQLPAPLTSLHYNSTPFPARPTLMHPCNSPRLRSMLPLRRSPSQRSQACRHHHCCCRRLPLRHGLPPRAAAAPPPAAPAPPPPPRRPAPARRRPTPRTAARAGRTEAPRSPGVTPRPGELRAVHVSWVLHVTAAGEFARALLLLQTACEAVMQLPVFPEVFRLAPVKA